MGSCTPDSLTRRRASLGDVITKERCGDRDKLKGRLGDLETTEILARVGAISDYLMSQCKMDSERTGEKVSRKREMGQCGGDGTLC